LDLLNNTDNENNSHLDPSSLSILIVDDNFDIVRFIERGLKEYGFNVAAFTDPVRTLEDFKVNCNHYNIILSDIRMPRMNGYEFVKKVKEIDKQAKIVVMSKFEVNHDRELYNMLTEVKIDSFLQKPFSMAKLTHIMEKIRMHNDYVFV
jgi:response regulator RpfG family c-di-GMP phosphodiesterase